MCLCIVYRLIPIARYAFKSRRICFRGTKYEINREHVCLLALDFYIVTPGLLWLELFASRVGWFLSRITYLPSNVFLRRCRSFTSRKLYVCLETFLCLFTAVWSSLCFSCSMYRFIPPLVVMPPHDSNVAVYAQVLLTVLRVVFAIVWLSSGHSRTQSPRSFWPAARIESSGLVQHWKSAIHGLPVKSGKSDWLRIRNEYSVHAQKIGFGQSYRSLPQARRIVGSGDETEFRRDHGLDPPYGSNQLPVFLKCSVRL